MLYKAIKQH